MQKRAYTMKLTHRFEKRSGMNMICRLLEDGTIKLFDNAT